MAEAGGAGGRGFPSGARQTGIPSLFFSDLLPAIVDPAELLVTIYAFYLLGRKRAADRWFVSGELRGEAPLVRAAGRLDGGARLSIDRGLDGAVLRGSLLRGEARRDGAAVAVYTVNVPGGAELLGRIGAAVPAAESDDLAVVARPLENIFALYEENIGVVSPLLAEQLREAAAEFPWAWIEAAFREAVALNRRNWRYIERILQRWRSEGPDLEAIGRYAAPQAGRRDLAGRYWRAVQR